MVRGKVGKPKVSARKSTGGVPPRARASRRETARKSTGGLAPRFPITRFPTRDEERITRDQGNNVDMDDVDEDDLVYRLPNGLIARRNSSSNFVIMARPPPPVTSAAVASSAHPNPSGQDPPLNLVVPKVESSRNMSVAALNTSSTSHQQNNNTPRILPENQTEAISVADSTNTNNNASSNTNTCEPSSTSSVGAPPLFVPPPAVPGHSRWLVQDNPANDNPANSSSQLSPNPTSSPPRPRRKKKHFTPLPFSESTPNNNKLQRRSSGSQENPFVINESSENNNNNSTMTRSFNNNSPRRNHHHIFDAKKVKKAFANFQSIRQLLLESGACSHFNGFVHLNAVEQMLIKCYKYSKTASNNNNNKSLDASNQQESQQRNPPVIILEDSNHSNNNNNNNNDNEAITTVRNVLFAPMASASLPPNLSSDVKVFATNNEVKMQTNDSPDSSPSMMIESNRSSSAEINLPSSSSSTSTASLTGTTTTTAASGANNVAKKKAAIVPSPEINKFVRLATCGSLGRNSSAAITTRPSFPSNSSSSRSSAITLNHIDEAINAAIRIGYGTPPPDGAEDDDDDVVTSPNIPLTNNNHRPPPPMLSNADLLAQMNDAHKETLNRLVLMGFGSDEEGQVFNQLLNIVRDNNGHLGACLDKLTR